LMPQSGAAPTQPRKKLKMAAAKADEPKPLKVVVFFGSAKDVTPPWGGDARLGDRVLIHVLDKLQSRAAFHSVTVYDPKKVFGEGGALEGDGELRYPHFYYKKGEAPRKMDEMQATIKEADCFLIVSPEYNHTVPPALSSMLGHFGGSNYAGKVSAIVTYSAGPFAGMRAAMAIKLMMGELGAIPISKLAGFGSVTDVFNPDGTPKLVEGKPSRLVNQLPKLLADLEWWAHAAKDRRESVGMPKY